MRDTLRAAFIVWLLGIVLIVITALIGASYCSGPAVDEKPAHYPVWSQPANPYDPCEPKLVRVPVIRRLHLFRTDLIPYPLHYEIYC